MELRPCRHLSMTRPKLCWPAELVADDEVTVGAANLNAIIAADPLQIDSPQGNGFARLKVGKSKAVTVTAKLADGTSFLGGGKAREKRQTSFLRLTL